jgi:glycosyltransferase involved in cell wall biosynthesis
MITFISLAPFPTTKAYGVTLKNTFDAAIDSGFEARIIAPNQLHPQNFKLKILNLIMEGLRHTYREGWVIRGRVGFFLHRCLFFLYLMGESPSLKNDILWLRDIRLAHYFSKYLKSQIVLEIHQVPNRFELQLLKKLSNKTIIAPISLQISHVIQGVIPRVELTLLPMGVPAYFFEEADKKPNVQFSLGYFGNFKSSGYSQGLEEMICDLGPVFRSDASFRVFIAGVGEEGYSVLTELANKMGIQDRLLVEKYLNHQEVPGKMRECRALIIPYPEGPYFASRFPIKAMEYASVKVPILCSNTESHNNIFDSSEVWFYHPDKKGDLVAKARMLYTSPEEAALKSFHAFEKSSQFTYRNRFKRIADRLDEIKVENDK